MARLISEARNGRSRQVPQMQDGTRIAAMKPRNVLLLTALLAAALTLLTIGKTYAQSETEATSTPTATALAAPRLTATASGDAIELSWTAVPGASRYELHTQLVAEPGWQQLDEGKLTATSYRHRGLAPGAAYQYAVRALDANGQPLGPWSNFPTATAPGSDASTSTPTPTPVATATPTATPGATPTPTFTPTPPASSLTAPVLTATASGDAIELSWTAVPGAARYALFTQRVDEPGWQQLDENNLTAMSHRHRDLVPGATYQYAVRAIDANGQPLGAWSNYPTATAPGSTMSTATPTPPVAATERSALIALYNATDGANWTHRDNWLSAAPLGTWHGVTTDANGRVTELRLAGNGLRGPIPDLSALTQLEGLFLSSNLLSGPIPDLNALTKLRWMNLSHNRLTGSIPDLNAPARLTELSFAFNQLSGPIPDLSALASLTVLSFARNQLSGTIPDLSALVNLRGLNLGHNRLSGPVPDLSSLANLVSLALQHNLLSGPLPDLNVLPKLVQLNLTANPFCLPDGRDSSGLHSAVAAHLGTLTLAPCTDAGTPTPTVTSTATPTATSSASTELAIPQLTARATGSGVELTWQAVSGAVRYELLTWWADDPGWQAIGGGALTGTSYTHMSVTAGRTYFYSIRAVNAAGETSAWLADYPTATALAATGSATATPTPTVTSTATAAAPATERAALVALYNATDGANWTDNANWLSAAPLETWYGVTTDENGRVTELRLGGNGLRGTIPDLSALRYLEVLFLSSNLLSGPAPELSALTKLRWMDLSRNRLTGMIPDLSGLVRITRLSLARNRLTGTIPDLSALVKLENLDLESNRLSGTIPDLSALVNLRGLVLGTNRLSGSVPDLSSLVNLGGLALQHNLLSGPLPDLRVLPKLVYLNLTANPFCLPDGRDSSGLHGRVVAHLRTLTLAPCTDAGTATPTPTVTSTATPTATSSASAELSMPQLTARATGSGVELTWEAVSGAVRYELLTWWADDPGWQAIGGGSLTGTSYTHADVTAGRTYFYSIRAVNAAGETSAWLADYPTATARAATGAATATPTPTATTAAPGAQRAALVALYNAAGGANWTHNANWLTNQPLGTWHGVTTDANGRVTALSLVDNGLSGSIPDLSALTDLEQLLLYGNSLSGPVPDLSAFTKLEDLYLSSNRLTGPIPDLSTLAKLENLDLSANRLSGSIPDLSALVNLEDLSLHTNELSGSIPDLSALVNLTNLFLNHNRLSGPLPDLSALANLERLLLYVNQLSGSIPDLSALVNLLHLDLGHNRLSGPLPDLSVLSNLVHLDLTGNRICLPDGARPTGLHSAVAAHLRTLNLASCTDAGTPTPTATARALTAPVLTAEGGAGQITLTWNVVAGAVRYDLWVWKDAVTDWQPLDDGSLTATVYTHGRLPAGATRWYTVRAVDANGTTGPWSESARATESATASGTQTPTPTTTAAPQATATPTATLAPGPEAAAQRAALVALYNATDGVNWTRRDNWLTDAPLSAWYGVTVDGGGRVTRLLLGSNRLSGSIPDLSALTGLADLSLYENELSGPIPDLSALASLTDLSLGSNDLSGPIPDLSALVNLENLALYSNRLSGSIPDLSALASLTDLSLSGNELSGPIPGLSALVNLERLSLYANDLSGPMPDLSALANLERLSLSGNQLSGSISDLSALVNLTDLSLGGNELSGSIPDLSALVNLERLSLYENELSGTIPDLSALVNLERLNLARNHLTGPVPDLSALVNLTDLDLGRNYLCLPEDAGLSDLDDDLAARVLDLFLPSCTGGPVQLPSSSPAERAALVALYNATDGANWTNNGNWLTDAPVAAWYGVTTDGAGRVTRLSLRDNGLSGQIPDLSGLANLTSLHLGANELSGSIPDLSALVNLDFLVLGGNELSGPFPDLSALTNLEEIHLYTNQLSGPIPDLSALVYLERLSLSGNDLSGPIPDLSALVNLWDLSLYNNELSGPIPDLSALVNLWYVELDSNQLTGSIPDLSALSSLRDLDLSGNQLTGSIPDLSAVTNLTSLALDSNQLTGSIPDLSAVTRLKTLLLSHNQLTGPIPDLSALTNLNSLSLSVNQLSGPIPDLSALANLRTLGLSFNQLTGPVPDLSALARLTRLSLSRNQLCLPAGADLSGVNQVAAEHLATLNLAACSDTELASVPGTPQNLAAAVGVGFGGSRVTLTWDAVADAAGYELWAWNGIDRAWGRIGGTLTGTSYAHSVLTDGRNYYYQVRARDANDVRGAWSERVFAAVVPQQFLPPPPSLGVNLFFYQKYADVGGIGVLAPSEISDSQMVQGREIVTGMLTGRSDLLDTLVAHETLIFIDIYRSRGIVFQFDNGWEAYIPATDPIPHCGTFIHELGHLIHYALGEQAGGEAFNARLRSAYQAAKAAGRWRDMYAMTNVREYWAEMVRIWLHEALPPSLAPYYSDLADYDSEAAALVEEVLDEDATVPAECMP